MIAAPGSAQPAQAASPVVVTAAPSPYGPVLFTAGGRALYLRSFDETTGPSPLHSTCTGTCAFAWPPLLVPGPNGPFAASHGVNAGELGTVQRPDGTFQVTYFGQPLYEFIRDASMPAGAVSGENVAAFTAFWHLDTTAGLPAPGQAHVILENTALGAVLAAQVSWPHEGQTLTTNPAAAGSFQPHARRPADSAAMATRFPGLRVGIQGLLPRSLWKIAPSGRSRFRAAISIAEMISGVL
jgi:predicted lipoprotein with Yx(FWY)xxD motif